MNPQQLEIVETFRFGQSVIAGAGCGKTTTLVNKCIELLRQNPDARFCAVSFTEKSVRDLKENLKKQFLKAGYDEKWIRDLNRRHWVKTIHGLCMSIIQEFPMEAGLFGGERIILEEESQNLWDRSLYLLWTRNENQEISEAVARLLHRYSKKMLEANFKHLRSLISFGVTDKIQLAMSDRPEIQDLWKVFLSVNDRFQQWKMKAGALDFNDLERFARIALDHPKVQKFYHERFQLVMVDEFQDTNPIQGEILEKFVKPDFSNFCIVGDPKQSIYRFRDADVSVFQDLSLKLPKKHLLSINYRSSPDILHFVNQLCAPVFEASGLDYEPLEPGRDEESFAEPRVFKLLLDDEYALARFLKSKESEGVDLSDYVILVRSVRKDKTQRFLNTLDEFQLPYLLGSGGRFYSDPRVHELVAFLKGWCSSNHSLSQATALRAPWIGISDEQLLEWKDDFFKNFFSHSSHPVAQALGRAYLNREPIRPGEVIEKIWGAIEEGGEMELTAASLWQKVEELSSRGNRFEEVVQDLVSAIEEDRIEKEIPPPAEKGMIRIMTIHASKGLQFPRVILLDFEGPYRSPSNLSDFIWSRKKGIHLYFRDEKGDRDKKNSENIKWSELEKAAAVAESKRLFYVAVTRPQEQLILGWKTEIKESSKEPSLANDDWRTWVELTMKDQIVSLNGADIPVPNLKEHGDRQGHSITTLKHKIEIDSFRPRHSPSEWMVLDQCPLRYQKKFFTPDWQDENQFRPEEDHSQSVENASRVAEKGLKVHSLLENEQFDDLIHEFKNQEIGETAVQSLREELNSSGSSGWKIFREIAFEVPFSDSSHGDEALVGMMDRLEVNPDEGVIRILDYKWTQSPKTPDQMVSQYRLQLELYSWAAIQLCGSSFNLKRLETKLIHLSEAGVTVIEVPIVNHGLNKRVYQLLQQARLVLDKERKKLFENPVEGDFCRYCEFFSSCPAKQ